MGENHPKKVVVVDDNEILLRAWERILADEPCVPFVTTSPEAALEHLEMEGADILVSDIVMPRMDGFDLIAKAQEVARRRHQKLRIVLTTGYVCDFTRIHVDCDERPLHVLLKPYNDIGDVEVFLHRLIEGDESVDRPSPDVLTTPNDLQIHLWNL